MMGVRKLYCSLQLLVVYREITPNIIGGIFVVGLEKVCNDSSYSTLCSNSLNYGDFEVPLLSNLTVSCIFSSSFTTTVQDAFHILYISIRFASPAPTPNLFREHIYVRKAGSCKCHISNCTYNNGLG